MAEVVGRAEIIVRFDGRNLPREAKELGDETGKQAGDAHNKEFNKKLKEGFGDLREDAKKQGKGLGTSFGQAMRDEVAKSNSDISRDLAKTFGKENGLDLYASKFDNATEAGKQLRIEMKDLQKQGLLTDDEYRKNSETIREWAKGHNAAGRELRAERQRIEELKTSLGQSYNQRLIDAASAHDDFAESIRRSARAHELAVADQETYLTQLREESGRTNLVQRENLRQLYEETNQRRGLLPLRRSSIAQIREERAGLLDHLRILGEDTTEIERTTRSLTPFRDSFRRSGRDVDSATKSLGGFNRQGKQAPYILKTIAGYTALFAGLAPGIAGLGSVAGSSLLVGAAGATALAVGLGVVISGFKGLKGELSDLPASVRPAAAAFQDLGAAFLGVQDTIQVNLFRNLEKPFQRLATKLIPVLDKGLGGIASTIGDLFADLSNGLTSNNGLQVISDLLKGFRPVLRDLGGGVLQLGAAFGHLFVDALPSLKGFSGFLKDLFSDFNSFTKSTEGQKQITEFFQTLGILAPKIGRLVGAAANALSDMVTPQSIRQLGDFLDTMSDFMPTLSDIVNIVDDLDPLGIVADAFSGLSDIIKPNLPALKDMAKALGGLAKDVIPKLAPALSDLVGDLAPVITSLATELGPAISDTVDDISDLVAAFGDIAPALPPAIKAISGLSKVLGPLNSLLPTVTGLLEGFGHFFDFFNPDDSKFFDLGSLFSGLVDSIGGIGEKILEPVTKLATSIGTGLGNYLLDHPLAKQIFDSLTSNPAFWSNADWGVVISGLGDFLTSDAALGPFIAIGKAIVDGIGQGLSDGAGDAWAAAVGPVGTAIVEAFKDFFGIHSPSQLMADLIGSQIPAGIVQGITDGLGDLGGAITGLLGIVLGGLGGVASQVAGLFSGVPQAVGDAVSGIGQFFVDLPGNISSAISGIPGLVGGIFSTAQGLVGQAVGGIVGFWNSLPPQVRVPAETAAGFVSSAFSNAVPRVQGAVNSVIGFAQSIPGRVQSAIAGVPGLIGSAFSNAEPKVRGTANIIVGLFSAVPGRVGSAVAGVGAAIGGAFNGAVSAVQGVVGRIVGAFSGLGGRILGTIGNIGAQVAAKLNFSGAIRLPKTATGGLFDGAQPRIIGEAGPEAVVPLRRDLAQVDPSVRALSAIAQGKGSYAVNGKGKEINVMDGAIRVSMPFASPELTGSAIIDRLVDSL